MTGPRYAELQVTSPFSFLRGASSAEEPFATAAMMGIEAFAVTDRNTLSGIVRAWEAAKATGVRLASETDWSRIYRFYCKTRKFSWVMTRKLSETLSRNFVHSCGMVSRMNARMASANCF